MSEDTPDSAAAEASEGEAGPRRPNVRKRPKHRGAGLTFLRSTFKRPPRPEELALRRAILLVLGAGVPLPLLFVGGLFLDGTLTLPGAKPSHGVHGAAHPGDAEPSDAPGKAVKGHGASAEGHGDTSHVDAPARVHGRAAPEATPSRERHEPAHPAAHAEVPAEGGGQEPPRHNLLGEAAHEKPTAAEQAPSSGPLTTLWSKLVGLFGGHPAHPAHGEEAHHPPAHGAESPGEKGHEQPAHGAEAHHPPAHGAESPGEKGHEQPAHGAEGQAGDGHESRRHAAEGHVPPVDGPERPAAAPLEEGAAPEPSPEHGALPPPPPTLEEATPRPRPRVRPTSPPPTLTARAVAAIAGAWLSATRPPEAAPAAVKEPRARRDAAPDPGRLTRQARQVSGRLRVQLQPTGPGVYGYRAPDGMARLRLEVMPDGGSQLQLVTDLGFLGLDREVRAHLSPAARRLPGGELAAFVERFPQEGTGFWVRKRPSFGLVDRYVATYMPPGHGTTTSARLDWWASMLRERVEDATRPLGEEGEHAWTPTFEVGSRVGRAFLAGSEFTLQLYIPPEDPGL